MLIGQPAEERGAGAKAMLDDKLFDRFGKPDYALALHVDATIPAGSVGYRGGFAMANVDSIDIIIKGKGGHGAFPHTTIDPIVQAAELILSLQTIVSREVSSRSNRRSSPSAPFTAAASITSLAKAATCNSRCAATPTKSARSFWNRSPVKPKRSRMANRAPDPEIVISEGTPALFNDEKLSARMATPLKNAVGEQNFIPREPSMGGEDFGRFGRAGVPILMFALGSVDGKRLSALRRTWAQNPPSLHSPVYYPDTDETLVTGVTAMSAAVLELMTP
jgi:metal-dependent amidase/aminoacylase/carboxypeptidase family protein